MSKTSVDLEPDVKSRVRIQLDLPPHEASALDAIRDRFALKSRADAVRTALAVVEWMQSEVDGGNRVLAVGPDHISYLTIPGLTIPRR